MTTPNLALSELVASQSQPHVPINTSLRALDALVQPAVIDILNDPTGASTDDGARYIIDLSATGAWAGREGFIAFRRSNAWSFLSPNVGWTAYVESEQSLYVYDPGLAGSPSNGWAPYASGGTGGAAAESELTIAAAPPTPNVGSQIIFSLDSGPNPELHSIDALVPALPIFTLFGGNVSLAFFNTVNTDTFIGLPNQNTTGSVANTNPDYTSLLKCYPRKSVSTSATINTNGVQRFGVPAGLMRSNTAFTGSEPFHLAGFKYWLRFGITQLNSDSRGFWGFKAAAADIGGTTDPSSLPSIIGVGFDAADTNLQFMVNDGSGTATKTDLGITKASVINKLLDLRIVAEPNGDLHIGLHDMDANLRYDLSATSDLPAADTLLYPHHQINAGPTTATAAIFHLARMAIINLIGTPA